VVGIGEECSVVESRPLVAERVNEGTCFHSAMLSRTGAAKTKVERESYAHVESDAMLVDDLVFQVRVAAGHVMMAAC
jgi:hypothetical protein